MKDSSYRVLPIQGVASLDGCFAEDVLQGLSQTKKSLPPQWFYDERGSQLFQQITEMDEYYLTRCEAQILERFGPEIVGLVKGRFRLVELGAGDGHKTKILLKNFLEIGTPFEFVPVDICEESVASLTQSLASELPQLSTRGLVAEYFEALRWLSRQDDVPTLVLFLGSNIGNFNDDGDKRFLSLLHAALKPQDLALVGFDLLKDQSILIPAYDDAAGVTTEFNLNLLDRINRELGADFDRSAFRHEARFNISKSRMESWLISLRHQTVKVPGVGRSFSFQKGEGIHVECSAKYTVERIRDISQQAGFGLELMLTDDNRWFCDAVLRRC